MANSKHAHLRYNILDYCFRNKPLSFDELLSHLNNLISEYYPGEGIATRTLRNDIKTFKDPIEGFGAPLLIRAGKYIYSDPNFSIATKPLLPYENYLIEASQQLLERFENHPKYDRLSEALIKFTDEDKQDNRVLFYDHNEEYKGIKHLKPLYLAIQKKQVLKITYQKSPEAEINYYTFHPHILKQYNRRWFVFGFNSKTDNWLWSIPLDDRLVKYEFDFDSTYLESNIDWNSHFRNLVGIRRNKEDIPQFIKLKFNSERRLNLFKSKPLVPDFDESLLPGEENVVHFETIINLELIQQILSYGKDLEVLEPQYLKEALGDHVNSMREFYSKK